MKKLAESPSVRTLEIQSTAKYMGTLDLTVGTLGILFFRSSLNVYSSPASVPEATIMLPINPAFHAMGGLATAVSESIWYQILYITMISDDVLPTCSNTMAGTLLKMDDNLHNMKTNSRRLNFLFVFKILYVMFHSSPYVLSANFSHLTSILAKIH
jgi:hypothetical protein